MTSVQTERHDIILLSRQTEADSLRTGPGCGGTREPNSLCAPEKERKPQAGTGVVQVCLPDMTVFFELHLTRTWAKIFICLGICCHKKELYFC
jgi:hypothetical protein